MMKRVSIFTLLLVLLFILFGCDNGSVSDSAMPKSSGLVKVCLTVDGADSGLQKASAGIAVDGNYWTSLTYQYNAVPQWRDPADAVIQGTAGWTEINYSSGMSLGYFAPGQWVFGVRVLDGTAVVYQGFSEVVDIKNSLVPVEVFVNKLAAESVRISVTASTAQGDSLSISYKNSSDVKFGPFIANATRLDGVTTFEYTINNLDAETYRFILTYSSDTGASIESQEQTLVLGSDKKILISGSVNTGSLPLVCTTVSAYTVTLNRYNWYSHAYDDAESGQYYYGNLVANITSAVAGDRVSFYVEPISHSSIDINAPPSVNDGAIDLVNNGNLYSFIMPDGPVNVKVKFTEPDDNLDINLNDFKTIIQSIYNENNVKAFGRATEIPAGAEYVGIKDVMIWYDTTDDINPICWYSKNGNTFKFDSTISTDMSDFFKDCVNYQSIDMTGIDTSNITDMSGMFSGCTGLTALNVSGLDTSNVTDMNHMFYMALEFVNTLNVSGFDVSKVTDFSYMFSGYYVGNYNNRHYTKVANLAVGGWTVGAGPYLDENENPIANVEINLANMFDYCKYLTSVDLTSWNFKDVVDMNRMFDRCEGLTSVSFPVANNVGKPVKADLGKVTDLTFMFANCELLDEDAYRNILKTWDIDVCHSQNHIDFSDNDNPSAENPNRITKTNDNKALILKGGPKYFKTYGHENDQNGGNIQFGGTAWGCDNNSNQRLVWKTWPQNP